jgi:hypothetical protein
LLAVIIDFCDVKITKRNANGWENGENNKRKILIIKRRKAEFSDTIRAGEGKALALCARPYVTSLRHSMWKERFGTITPERVHNQQKLFSGPLFSAPNEAFIE